MSHFHVTQFHTYAMFKIKKNSNILHTGTEFVSCRKCKGNETEVVEEYCWAMAQAAEKSCCGRSGSNMLEFVCVCVYIYIYIYIYIVDRM
jgi:hypothetical protein